MANIEPDWRLEILQTLIERVYAQLAEIPDQSGYKAQSLHKLLLPLLREYRMTAKDGGNARASQSPPVKTARHAPQNGKTGRDNPCPELTPPARVRSPIEPAPNPATVDSPSVLPFDSPQSQSSGGEIDMPLPLSANRRANGKNRGGKSKNKKNKRHPYPDAATEDRIGRLLARTQRLLDGG